MRSKLSIEVDFENGNRPVIQVLYKSSDDVRDNLVKAFLQELGGSSNWCFIKRTVDYIPIGSTEYDSAFTKHIISIVRPEELKEHQTKMIENIEWMENVTKED